VTLYSFWVGNHVESNARVCAALKRPEKKLQDWKSRGARDDANIWRDLRIKATRSRRRRHWELVHCSTL